MDHELIVSPNPPTYIRRCPQRRYICDAREQGCSDSARDSYSGGGGGKLDPFWDDCCCVCALSLLSVLSGML